MVVVMVTDARDVVQAGCELGVKSFVVAAAAAAAALALLGSGMTVAFVVVAGRKTARRCIALGRARRVIVVSRGASLTASSSAPPNEYNLRTCIRAASICVRTASR